MKNCILSSFLFLLLFSSALTIVTKEKDNITQQMGREECISDGSKMLGGSPSQTLVNWSISTDKIDRSVPMLSEIHNEEPMKINVLGEDGQFEKNNSLGLPVFKGNARISSSGSSYKNETFKGIVHGGSNALQFKTIGTSQFYIQSSISQYVDNSPPNRPYLNETMTFSMYYYINQVVNGSSLDIQLNFGTETNQYFSVYYVLWYSTTNLQNSSSSKIILLNTTSLNTWNYLERNITKDVETLFGSDLSITYLRFIYINQYSPVGATKPLESIFDDISVKNKTNSEFVKDGDLENEAVNYWNGGYQAPGYVFLDTDHVKGNYSMKAYTSHQNNTNGYVNLYYYFNYQSSYYFFEPNQTKIYFSWKYVDIENGGGQYSSFNIYLRNATGYYSIIYVLGADLNRTSSFYNSTSYRTITSSNFGIRNQWVNEEIDLYELISGLNMGNTSINYISFNIYSGTFDNSSVSLYLDNVMLESFPFGDPSFETKDYSGTYKILAWSYYGNTTYFGYSDEAISGKQALNLTVIGDSGHVYRTFYYPLQLTNDMFLDFYWKISSLDQNAFSYVGFSMYLEGGKTIIYYLIYNGDFNNDFTNSSNTLYLKSKNFNTTLKWNEFLTSPFEDLTSYFGSQTWNLTQVNFFLMTTSNTKITFLLDDINFFSDTHPPQIQKVSLTNSPNYLEGATLEVNATDELSGVSSIDAYYSTSRGDKGKVTSSFSTGIFTIVFPIHPFNTVVTYYLNASDKLGNWAIYDNNGQNYSYTSWDYVSPLIKITNLQNNSVFNDNVTISFEASDAGSNISHVEFYANQSLVLNTTQLSSVTWNTRTINNGTYIFRAIAFDNAGNNASSASFVISIENDLQGPTIVSVLLDPKSPQYGQDVTVLALITDTTGISKVSLYYAINGSYNELLMNQVSSLYQAIIPGQPWGTEVTYYVEAYDVYGLKSNVGSLNSPLSFVFGDSKSPVLSINGPAQGDVLEGNVIFQINGYDEGSGIKNVTIAIDGKVVGSYSKLPTEFEWKTNDYDNGEHEISFILFDKAGNNASLKYSYLLDNPSALGKFFENTSTALFAKYGVLTGIFITVVAYFLVKTGLRKFKKPGAGS